MGSLPKIELIFSDRHRLKQRYLFEMMTIVGIHRL